MSKIMFINGFSIFGLDIKFYGILIALSFIIGLFLVNKLVKLKGYNSNLPYNLLLLIFPAAIIGARAYYIIFSGRSWTFAEMFQVWNGGLAIYGGIIASVLVIVIYCIIKKINIIRIFDLLVPALILGQAIGRWGNFFNQEAYGYAVQNSSFHWFPFAVFIEADGLWHYATFFYESMWCLIGFFIVYNLYKRTKDVGLVTCFYLIYYGIERFFVEGLRTDSLYVFSNLRVSQLLSLIMVLIGTIFLILLMVNNKKKFGKYFNFVQKTESVAVKPIEVKNNNNVNDESNIADNKDIDKHNNFNEQNNTKTENTNNKHNE